MHDQEGAMAVEEVTGSLVLRDGMILARNIPMYLKTSQSSELWSVSFVWSMAVMSAVGREAFVVLEDGRSGTITIARRPQPFAASNTYQCAGLGPLTPPVEHSEPHATAACSVRS